MTRLRVDYYNYAHFGRRCADYHGNSGPHDFAGLVREMSRGDGWPDVLVLGEADRAEDNGGEAAWEAAAALRVAGSPPYVPHFCGLPREGGPFAPVVYIEPRTITTRRFCYHRLPDFASRNRNLLIFTLPGRDDWYRLIAIHGDIHDEDMRLADAKTFDRLADPAIPTVIAGDWNSTLSGPQWEPRQLNTPGAYAPRQLSHWSRWQRGPDWGRPREADTRSLDLLCGWWDQKQRRRIGGIGFHAAAELAGDTTGAYIGGAEPVAMDHILLNQPWQDRLVSYRVYQPVDPGQPDSDHLRISAELEV